MKEPDAIVVLAGAIWKDQAGHWVSTGLTEEENAFGAPGGALRVAAAAELARQHESAMVVASGGRGYDVPKDAPEDKPLLAYVLKRELSESGVSDSRIISEEHSNSTYQQLQEIEKLIMQKNWQSVMLITNRYHVERLTAMIEKKFPEILNVVQAVSAEEVLIGAHPEQWKSDIENAYAGSWMAERITREKQGVAQIQNGTYHFK